MVKLAPKISPNAVAGGSKILMKSEPKLDAKSPGSGGRQSSGKYTRKISRSRSNAKNGGGMRSFGASRASELEMQMGKGKASDRLARLEQMYADLQEI